MTNPTHDPAEMEDALPGGLSPGGSSPGSLSPAGAVAALVLAIGLSVLLYILIGFPENLPIGFGGAIFLAELGERALRNGPRSVTRAQIVHSTVRAVLIAGACALGVWMASVLG